MKVRSKLLITLTATTVVVCGLFGFGGAHLLSRAVRESTIERINRELVMMSTELPVSGDVPELIRFAEQHGRDLGLRVTLIGPRGAVIADSVADEGTMDNHLRRPEILAALESERGESFRRSATTSFEYYYRAVRVTKPPVGFIRIALRSSELDQFGAQYLLILLVAIASALMFVGALAWYAVARLVRPVERITHYAERVASGELDTAVPTTEENELSILASSVNRMRESLVTRVDEIGAERGLFRTMTEGLDEGLVLLDSDQRVLLVNEAFRKIFRLESSPVDRRLQDVVADPAILDLVSACLESGKDLTEIIPGPAGTSRSFDVHVSRVTLPGERWGVLGLMFDITRQEALEQVRQRFIADVSHELRTPVTSIMGAVETLLDSGIAVGSTERRFLEIARRQAGRMSDLIADLTDLSRIETGAIDLERRELPLVSLTRDVIEAVASRHSSRDVRLEHEIPEDFTVFVDGRRLEQILVNLVDNAIKYTPDGGTVKVSATHGHGYDVITVEDTGPGIPVEDREKVFNRFFRVDKARSRELGGTGLGLAIVKHLVKLHHGTILVDEAEPHGAKIVLEFPADDQS